MNKTYTFEEKKSAVRRHLLDGEPMNRIAKEYGTAAATILQWVRKYKENGDAGLKSDGRGRHQRQVIEKSNLTAEEEIALLKKDILFLKKVLARFAEEENSQK